VGGAERRAKEEQWVRWVNSQFKDREREDRWREDHYRDRARRDWDFQRGVEGDWSTDDAKRRAMDQRNQHFPQPQGNRPIPDLRDRLNVGKA